MVDILDPDEEDLIIDPACGSGGFLIEALRHVWRKLDAEGEKYHWSKTSLQEEKMKYALYNIKGLDKDYFLAKVAKAYMALIGDGKSGIFCEDSLENPKNWGNKTRQEIKFEEFSVLLTNPPFGSKIPVRGEEKLKQFELGHKWKLNKKTGEWEKGKLKNKEAPQILFIERCLQLLKDGGRMAIVLPDGIYGNESLAYIRNWLLKQGRIIAIIDVPIETFMPNTSTKTTILIFQKLSEDKIPEDYPIFMAVAETCGHDRRGKATKDDDVKQVVEEFKKWAKEKNNYQNKKQFFKVKLSEIADYDLWSPRFLYPYYLRPIQNIERRYPIYKIGELFDIKKGIEVGSNNYINYIFKRDDDVPFIRTSDLVNYTLNKTTELFVAKDIYGLYKRKLNLTPGDLLFTKDGKIGYIALVGNNIKFIPASGISILKIKREVIKEIKKKYNVTIDTKYIFSILMVKEIGLFQSLRRTVIASTIPHISINRLKDVEIPIITDQSEINKLIQLVNKLVKLDEEKFEIINELKDKARESLKEVEGYEG